MMLERVRYPITDGRIKVPAWEPRREPCEWAAVLCPLPDGGIGKDAFLGRGPDEASFFVDELRVGAAIVFAADYVTVGPRGGKNKTQNRWYGVVRALGRDFVEIERHESEQKAILATDLAQERAQARAQGTAEPRRRLEARRDELQRELSKIEYQLGVDALLHMRRFENHIG